MQVRLIIRSEINWWSLRSWFLFRKHHYILISPTAFSEGYGHRRAETQNDNDLEQKWPRKRDPKLTFPLFPTRSYFDCYHIISLNVTRLEIQKQKVDKFGKNNPKKTVYPNCYVVKQTVQLNNVIQTQNCFTIKGPNVWSNISGFV